MTLLAERKCIPCEEGGDPLTPDLAEALLKKELVNGWMLIDNAHILVKEFRFADFAQAMGFANKVAAIAEEEGHHPDLTIGWGTASVELTTHSVGGLSENDFIVAAKIDLIT